ncbi:dihydroxyacetone kinase phosphoryl donor subunit DhaM [Quadrisphaera sp. DSM 44207]|uniref:dihydroxyacetone kinase phosphoryl donor subunit DhaM n=1 Tax=Quadrisphaera sp. DSM 44207 TaxID=1881057 RepID=UPI00088AD419|nr:dihydroxyacetone kinase phosphoryl donor subunit DhaM [Quadrisphaera sp. DSM 44207]SDQ49877.1 dihydroxyacetone kinase, phosphotransfer subunit [Quadrisphaera sp. DSM 44207]
MSERAGVGLVVVSHSRALAQAAVDLARQVVPGDDVALAVAAGLDDGSLGTDALAVQRAVEEVDSPAGVLVLLDLGSAVLSAETALDLLADDVRERVRLSAGPLVEGLVAAAVTASTGAGLDRVAAEADAGLRPKQEHLAPSPPPPPRRDHAAPDRGDEEDAVTATLVVDLPHGLHARPAARLVAALAAHDADVRARASGSGPDAAWVPATSATALAGLALRRGEELQLRATGPGAQAAVRAGLELAARSFDEAPAEAAPGADGGVDAGADAGAGPVTGPALVWRAPQPPAPPAPGTPAQERARLDAAVAAATEDVDRWQRSAAERAQRVAGEVLQAHRALLADPALVGAAVAALARGGPAEEAWSAAVADAAARLAGLADPYLRARAADVRAVGELVRWRLAGRAPPAPALAPERTPRVLVAEDLSPEAVAALGSEGLLAVVLTGGDATSHAVQVLRASGVPVVAGAGADLLPLPDGAPVTVDAAAGTATAALPPRSGTDHRPPR